MATVVESGATLTYLVNGLGQRVSKASTAVPTCQNLYMYDEAGHLIGEYNATGQRIQETVYYGDTPVATEVGTSGTVYSISPDWQNTPHIVANSSGTFAWSWDRAAFGDNAPNTNPGGLGTFTYNPRFPGQLADVEDGLSNNVFRDYTPSFGRYIQSDAIGLAGGINSYNYVNGNPIMLVDVLGLDAHVVLLSQNNVPPILEWSPFFMPANYNTAIIHGSNDGNFGTDMFPSTTYTPQQLASLIKNWPGYDPSHPLVLLACKSGATGGAQALANELGTPVLASTDNVYPSSDSFFGPPETKVGGTVPFQLFYPQVPTVPVQSDP